MESADAAGQEAGDAVGGMGVDFFRSLFSPDGGESGPEPTDTEHPHHEYTLQSTTFHQRVTATSPSLHQTKFLDAFIEQSPVTRCMH
jgi:hypothetical protein